jgi:hypothetical protein
MKCRFAERLPSVVTDWQQEVLCPACRYFHRGRCAKPQQDPAGSACPFDEQSVPLRAVGDGIPPTDDRAAPED